MVLLLHVIHRHIGKLFWKAFLYTAARLFLLFLCVQWRVYVRLCVSVCVGFGKVMSFLLKFRGGNKSPKSTKTLGAIEISSPCDMRHEIHVGWDDDGCLQGIPESWRLWMQHANIRYQSFKPCEVVKLATEISTPLASYFIANQVWLVIF